MAALFPLKRHWVALILMVAFASGSIAARKPDPDPEPPSEKGGEKATEAVDLTKAKTDPKLAATLKNAIDPADGFPLGADWR